MNSTCSTKEPADWSTKSWRTVRWVTWAYLGMWCWDPMRRVPKGLPLWRIVWSLWDLSTCTALDSKTCLSVRWGATVHEGRKKGPSFFLTVMCKKKTKKFCGRGWQKRGCRTYKSGLWVHFEVDLGQLAISTTKCTLINDKVSLDCVKEFLSQSFKSHLKRLVTQTSPKRIMEVKTSTLRKQAKFALC